MLGLILPLSTTRTGQAMPPVRSSALCNDYTLILRARAHWRLTNRHKRGSGSDCRAWPGVRQRIRRRLSARAGGREDALKSSPGFLLILSLQLLTWGVVSNRPDHDATAPREASVQNHAGRLYRRDSCTLRPGSKMENNGWRGRAIRPLQSRARQNSLAWMADDYPTVPCPALSGTIFWFTRNRLPGSYLVLMDCSLA